MAADRLAVYSLREALQAAMEPQPPRAAVRDVIVRAVHLGQAAALQAFLHYQELQLHYQESRAPWKVLNARRLAQLVCADALLRALATDLVPILIDNPASRPALELLLRYAHHFKATAGAVGGSFAHRITLLADDLVKHAKFAGRITEGVLSAQELLRRTQQIRARLNRIRSSQLTISDKADNPDADHPASDYGSDDEEFDLDVTTLREALQAVADDPGAGRRVTPGAGRRVTVSGVKLSDSASLRAVLRLQASPRGRGWAVRGLGSLATLASVDACCHAVEAGFLRILVDDPTRVAALALLEDFAVYVKGVATSVDGTLLKRTTKLCDKLIGHANAANRLAAAEMLKSANNLRRRLGRFRARHISIRPGSDDDTSASSSASNSSDDAAASASE